MDWMAGSMPDGTRIEHLGPKAVRITAKISMIQDMYSRLNDIGYLRKIGQWGTEPESSIT